MKRIVLAFALILTFAGVSFAVDKDEVVYSSYTEGATAGWVVFSTGPTQFLGVVVSSPAPGSAVYFFRSTSPFVTPDLSTQAAIATHAQPQNNMAHNVDLYRMTNSSYTLVNKIGNAKLTYFFKLIGGDKNVTPPGLKNSGNVQ